MIKKILAIVLAAAMLLAVGAASAATGWAQRSDAKTYKNFKVEVKAYESRENSAGLALSSFLNGGAADEITGRVVIGTIVVIKVKVTVPMLKNTDLLPADYENGKLNMTFGNLDVTGDSASLLGASPNFYTGDKLYACEAGAPATLVTPSKVNTKDEDYDITVNTDEARYNNKELVKTYIFVAQAKTTAECPVSATFTMGQDCSAGVPYYVVFQIGDDYYRAGFNETACTSSDLAGIGWNGVHNYLVVAKMQDVMNADYALCFKVNSADKLSEMKFVNSTAGYSLDICGDCGHLKFTDGANPAVCDCTNESLRVSMEKNFNKLLAALGFDYQLGSMDYGYATTKDVNGLANQVKVAAGYTFNECTELAAVDIPQTGAFAYGFAAVALAVIAGAAAAIRKFRA